MTATSASGATAAPIGTGNKLLPSLGILLVAGGLFVLGWVVYLWNQPELSPYHYELVEEGGAEKLGQLGLESWPDLSVAKYEVRVESVDKPIAVAYRAIKGNGRPVLLSWENRIPEPVISMGNVISELKSVATSIATHVPKEAIILGWWDTSRQLGLLADRQTLFTSHLGQPIVAPSYWKNRENVINRYEREFWGGPGSDEESAKFQRFVDALVAYPNEGAAILRELAGQREAYVVVHVTDIFKLGLMRPDRLDVAFKNFPLTGNVHGLTGQIKAWMKENKYDTYTLQSMSDREVRAYFLRETPSGTALLARMLPFTNWRPVDLEALQLTHKSEGYWIYKLPSLGQPLGRSPEEGSGTARERMVQ